MLWGEAGLWEFYWPRPRAPPSGRTPECLGAKYTRLLEPHLFSPILPRGACQDVRGAGAHESGKEIVGGARGVRALSQRKAEPVGWRLPRATSKQKQKNGGRVLDQVQFKVNAFRQQPVLPVQPRSTKFANLVCGTLLGATTTVVLRYHTAAN